MHEVGSTVHLRLQCGKRSALVRLPRFMPFRLPLLLATLVIAVASGCKGPHSRPIGEGVVLYDRGRGPLIDFWASHHRYVVELPVIEVGGASIATDEWVWEFEGAPRDIYEFRLLILENDLGAEDLDALLEQIWARVRIEQITNDLSGKPPKVTTLIDVSGPLESRLPYPRAWRVNDFSAWRHRAHLSPKFHWSTHEIYCGGRLSLRRDDLLRVTMSVRPLAGAEFAAPPPGAVILLPIITSAGGP